MGASHSVYQLAMTITCWLQVKTQIVLQQETQEAAVADVGKHFSSAGRDSAEGVRCAAFLSARPCDLRTDPPLSARVSPSHRCWRACLQDG